MKLKKDRALHFLKLFAASLIMGIICGAVGAAFAGSISFVTALRAEHSWLLYLLPIAGLATVLLYNALKVSNQNTNRVLESVKTEKKISLKLAPAVFAASVLTHLCGGSAGKEGAALQLGGSIAYPVSKIFGFDENERHTVVLCGMAALFSAVFGTPLGAFVFALEVVCIGKACVRSAFPVLASSLLSFGTAQLLGAHAERFDIGAFPEISFSLVWKFGVICICGAAAGFIFCRALHFCEHLFKRLFKNAYIRIFLGGALIVLLSAAVGSSDYNGGGMHIIERIFETGEVRYEAFLLKIIFTSLTVAAGFKGGEIVPTFFIGAALGGALSVLLGISPAFGAAVGMVTLFCSMTNCPIASAVLAAELFGIKGIVFYAAASAAGFFLSGKGSLYEEN